MSNLKNDLYIVYDQIALERKRQDEKWGGPAHDDTVQTTDAWCDDIIAYTTWAKQMARMKSPAEYRHRMMQVAALAVAACESYDRITNNEPSGIPG